MEPVPFATLEDISKVQKIVLDDQNPPAIRIESPDNPVGHSHGPDHHNPPVLKLSASDEEYCPPMTMPGASETMPPAIKDPGMPEKFETVPTRTIDSSAPVLKSRNGILQQAEQNIPDNAAIDSSLSIQKSCNGNLPKTTSESVITSPNPVVTIPTRPGETMKFQQEMRNPPTLQVGQKIALAAVGDGGVGKSCLLITYMTGKFPQEAYSNYLAFGYYDQKVTTLPGGKRYTVQLYDTQGQEDYDRLRPLCYKDADVFLVCFSVAEPHSLTNVLEKWVPEITHHCPKKPFLLVGTQTDLRNDASTLNSLAKRKIKPVPVEEGERLAKVLRAVKYVECSTRTQEGLLNVFNEAIIAASSGEPRSRRRCILL